MPSGQSMHVREDKAEIIEKMTVELIKKEGRTVKQVEVLDFIIENGLRNTTLDALAARIKK